MDSMKLDYYNLRAEKARLGRRLKKPMPMVLAGLAVLLLLVGVAMLVLALPAGWLVLSLASIPFALRSWYEHDLRHLPTGKGDTIDAKLSGDILGQLPKNPSPYDLAVATGQVVGGQFMGVRLGLTPTMLQEMASREPGDMPGVWDPPIKRTRAYNRQRGCCRNNPKF